MILPLLVAAAQPVSSEKIPHQPALMKREFIFERSPVPTNHSSTIVETKTGLLAAWFGGPQARHPEVSIWSARYDGKRWSAAREIVSGMQPDGTRYQCWNPVLFQPSKGPLLLFYKAGPSPEAWWGMLMTSTNHGETWSVPLRLPDGFVGPVRNKPVELSDGSLLCGASTEQNVWSVHMERAFEPGPESFRGWEKTAALDGSERWAAIQPTILMHSPRIVQILCRTKQGAIVESWSKDEGRSWSPMTRTALPNPNSAIDVVRLGDGRFLLVYNHSSTNRGVLNVAVSDDGKKWQSALVLENQAGEFSYPAVIQSSDGVVHITYSWNRQKIRHVTLDPGKLKPTEISNSQ